MSTTCMFPPPPTASTQMQLGGGLRPLLGLIALQDREMHMLAQACILLSLSGFVPGAFYAPPIPFCGDPTQHGRNRPFGLVPPISPCTGRNWPLWVGSDLRRKRGWVHGEVGREEKSGVSLP